MTNEHDGGPQRWLAGARRASRPRGEAFDASPSRQTQPAPGRSTLTEALDPAPDPAPLDVARAFDAQLEVANRQLAALEVANHAGDHHESGLAASGLRTALRIAEKVVVRIHEEREDRAAVLDHRLRGAWMAARSALAQAFTPSDAALREAVAGGQRTQWGLEVAAWHAARGGHGNTKQQPGPEADDARKEAETALDAWAGAGVSGRIFRNDTAETFIDAVTGDTVEVRTDWMLAEFESFELSTNTLMAIEREIHIQLARGVSLVIKSRARAWFHTDRLPSDVHAALHAPARLIRHQGTLFVTGDKGAHLLEAFSHPFVKEQSVAGLLGNEPMLGFETDGPQRIREAEQFYAVTVPQHDANLKAIGAILRDAAATTISLRRYIEARLAYASPSTEPISNGRHMIHRIEALTSGTWTGYEGTAVLFRLEALRVGYTKLVVAAENAKPADKDAWDHAADAARAIGGAIVGVGVAIKELVLTARDLGLWLADEVVNLLGSDLDWSAASSIGKAYQAGKSTGEIFMAVVDGLVGAWDKAIEHASNGDYSKLMNLGAELALDVAIGVATAGTAMPALAAERVGAGARLASRALALAEPVAEALARRARTTLAKLERAIDAAPAAARRAALELQDTLQGVLDGLATARHLVDAATGARMAVLDPGTIPRAIQRLRGARAMADLTGAAAKLRGSARLQGQKIATRLQKLRENPELTGAVDMLARRIAKDEDKAKLFAALDRMLDAWPARTDHELLARVMRRAAGPAVDMVKFLNEVTWAMGHKGLSPAAREGLIRHAVRRKKPLDLCWLRELTELPDPMLEFMALDPATHWHELMKVSTKPSDYFSSRVKKLLGPNDYARAAGKLRGIAGELVFVVEGIELPGGLKIVGRQVKAGSRTIDFMLQDAQGKQAMLEVKAWSRKTWQRELAVNPLNLPARSAANRMIEQLQAARATGRAVYLAVPDAIGEDVGRLRHLLDQHHLKGVKITPFPETKLQRVAAKLRAGLALASGVALAITDQAAKDYVEQENR